MPDTFDPYHKWLGISAKDQPPNHYRLLGVEAFESDPDVIESAADQRMTHVRTFQAGQHSALSQRMLNELSAAKLCLLAPEKKAAYDRQLRQSLGQATTPAGVSAPTAASPSQRPWPQARPLAVEQAVPLIVPETKTVSSPVRRPRRKTPLWLQPAVLGTVAAALLLAIVGYFAVTARQTGDAPEAPKRTVAANDKAPPARQTKDDSEVRSATPAKSETSSSSVAPEKTDDAPSNLQAVTRQDTRPGIEPPLSLVAGTSRPEAPGVLADRVVLWNQHNGNARDRGTRECRLSLWREGREIWAKGAIEIPWTPDGDENVSVAIPATRFDRLRVEITRWERTGGGLAEIEVMQGDRNLALGCPVLALAAFDSRFLAANLTDGVHTSTRGAYWLLQDGTPGWAEVDLAFAEPQSSPGVSADKLVIWNTHNAHHRDRGALVCNVRLSLGSEEVWRQDDVAIPWEPNADGRVEIALPDKRFDRVRVDIPRWQDLGAGLSELEVKRGEVNLARACPVIASGKLEYPYVSSAIVDGITSSNSDGVGYWLAPDSSPAWAEIDLSWNAPEIGARSQLLGQYRVLVENDWPRGLPWLARSNEIDLRAVAGTDGRLTQLWSLDALHAPQAALVGDRWWEIAQASPEPAKQELLLRALYRYAAAIPLLPENEQPRLEERISQSLPLAGGTWLYLLKESDVNHVWRHNTLRRRAVVDAVRHPWAFWMIPDPNESASVSFALGGKYRRFSGAAALDDSSQGLAASPVTFTIVGDDRELLASKPLQGKYASEPFDVDVSGIARLRLVVECPGSHDRCHAVWVDPVFDAASPSRIARAPSTGTVGTPKPSDDTIDLLKRIDTKRDAVAGEWRMENGALITPSDAGARLRIDYEVPSAYDVSLTAERIEGKGTLGLGLVVEGAQVLAAVEAFNGTITGLDSIDGKACNDNETTYRRSVLKDGVPNRLEYHVRPDHVQVIVNGEKLIDWRGDSRKLTTSFAVPDPPALSLVVWGARYRITGLELSPATDGKRHDSSYKFADLALGRRRLELPASDEQRRAKQDLLKRIAPQISAAKTPDLKRKLAEELTRTASAAEEPDANTYVAFSEAIELAEAASDLDLAWQAIDELAAYFAIDAVSRRYQSLSEIGKGTKSPERYRELTDDACQLIAEALAAEDAGLVKKAAAQAQSFAKRSKDSALVKSVAARTKDAAKLADQIDATAAARETLKTSPDDAHANFLIGHYELCAAGDRQRARVKLAKGDDAPWQKLAKDDSAPAGNPQQQLALADAWWSQAEKEIWPGQHYLRVRAGDLYRRAVASLSGGERTHALNRLKDLLAVDDGLPDWGLFDLGRAEKRNTYVRLDPRGTLRTCVEYDAPMDITFVARTDSLNIRLFAHNYPSVIWNWEVNPSELRVANPDGETIPALATSLEANRWYTLRYRVTSQGTTVSVDGLSVFSENKAYAKFPRSPVGVNGEGPAVIDVKKFVVRPIE